MTGALKTLLRALVYPEPLSGAHFWRLAPRVCYQSQPYHRRINVINRDLITVVSMLSIATLSPLYQCYQSQPYHRRINVINRDLITVVSMLSIATLSLSYQCYRLQPYRCCINVIDCNLTPLYQCYRSQPYTVVSSLSIISVILINRDRHEHRWRAGAK